MKYKFFNFSFLKSLKGQVLLEGLIALSLASIIIIAIVTAVTSSVSTSRVSNLKNSANQFAQQAVELARTQRGLAEGFYCLSKDSAQLESPVAPETCESPNIDNTFIRTVEVVEDGCAAGVNNVIVSVSWADTTCEPGEFCQNVQLASCIDPSGGIIAGNFPVLPTDPNYTPPPTPISLTPTQAPNPPVVSISANPVDISYGGQSTISWSSTAATSCTSVEGLTNPIGLSGNQTKTNLTSSTDYTIRCTNIYGDTERTVTVNVAPPPVPTHTFTALPASILTLNEVTLSWSSTNSTSCTASGGWSGTKTTSGTEKVYPSGNITYSLYCTGIGGQTATINRSVTVTLPPRFVQSINASTLNIRTCASTTCGTTSTSPMNPYEVAELLNAVYSVYSDWRWFNIRFEGVSGWAAGQVISSGAYWLVEMISSFASTPSSQSSSITDYWVLFTPANTVTLREVACPNCGASAHMTIYDSNGTIDNQSNDTTVYPQTTASGNYSDGTFIWRAVYPFITLTAGRSYILKVRNSLTPIYYGTTNVNRSVINFSHYKIGAFSNAWNNGSLYIRMIVHPILPVPTPASAPSPSPSLSPSPSPSTVTPTPTPGTYYKTEISNLTRRTPDACGTSQGGVPLGTVGKYLAGPTLCNDYNRYELQTAYNSTGWFAQSSGPWLTQVVFPQSVTSMEGLDEQYTACTYTADNCQRSTLIKPNFNLRISKIACQNCNAKKWWIYNSTSTFGSGSLIASGTTFSTVSPGWREVTLSPHIVLNRNSYYRIVFGIDVPVSTFWIYNGVTQRQYVDFLQARNDDSGFLHNPGTYDIRLEVTGL